LGYKLVFGHGKLLVVKSAMISFLIPKIVEIFPADRFIHLYRSGPSVIESYIKKNYGTYSRYTFDEDEYRVYCASYWNECILDLLRTGIRGIVCRAEGLTGKPSVLPGSPRGGFGFDTSSIRNQNHKVGSYMGDPRWTEPLRAMEQAMRLKGYIP
jgi:hypothetical protein